MAHNHLRFGKTLDHCVRSWVPPIIEQSAGFARFLIWTFVIVAMFLSLASSAEGAACAPTGSLPGQTSPVFLDPTYVTTDGECYGYSNIPDFHPLIAPLFPCNVIVDQDPPAMNPGFQLTVNAAAPFAEYMVQLRVLDASDGVTVIASYQASVRLRDRTPPRMRIIKQELVKCAASGETTVSFTQSEMLNNILRVISSVDDPACFGTAGSIKLYLGNPQFGGNQITGDQAVAVGNSVVVFYVVTDYAGNITTDSIILGAMDSSCGVASLFNFTAESAHASCGANDGTISIKDVTGGAAPYT